MIATGIDGDILLYKCAFACDDEPINIAMSTMDKMINNIVKETEADSYVIFLTGKGNFRDKVATIQGYKENRKDNEKPRHYDELRTHLRDKHDAIVIDGMEADDALGEFLTDSDPEFSRVCASCDKDLLMVSGTHFNINSRTTSVVTPDEGWTTFCIQCLTGDPTDNIPGLKRITGKVATKAIKDSVRELEGNPHAQWGAVCDQYPDNPVELSEIADLLWIRQEGMPYWRDYLDSITLPEEEIPF